MIHTISKGNYSAQISELGAELKSFKNKNTEYMWDGNPDIWSGTAPVLFPIVGKLKNYEYYYDGKTYKMDQHGFARKQMFDVYEKKKEAISFILRSSDETKQIYPFDFELIIIFEIDNDILTVSYYVLNIGSNSMLFTIGSHPAFALQTKSCKLSDYYIEFDKKETTDCYRVDDGLLLNNTIPQFMNNEKIITLSNSIFDADALVFKNILSNLITIKNKVTGYNLSVKTGGAPHLGIWSKPGASYVCIEPWFGFADAINTNGDLTQKEGMLRLEPEKRFITGYQIIV